MRRYTTLSLNLALLFCMSLLLIQAFGTDEDARPITLEFQINVRGRYHWTFDVISDVYPSDNAGHRFIEQHQPLLVDKIATFYRNLTEEELTNIIHSAAVGGVIDEYLKQNGYPLNMIRSVDAKLLIDRQPWKKRAILLDDPSPHHPEYMHHSTSQTQRVFTSPGAHDQASEITTTLPSSRRPADIAPMTEMERNYYKDQTRGKGLYHFPQSR